MLKSKFQHMGEKEHYKMYKAGKMWIFANLLVLSLGTIIAGTSVTNVEADTTDISTSSVTTASDNINSTVKKDTQSVTVQTNVSSSAAKVTSTEPIANSANLSEATSQNGKTDSIAQSAGSSDVNKMETSQSVSLGSNSAMSVQKNDAQSNSAKVSAEKTVTSASTDTAAPETSASNGQIVSQAPISATSALNQQSTHSQDAANGSIQKNDYSTNSINSTAEKAVSSTQMASTNASTASQPSSLPVSNVVSTNAAQTQQTTATSSANTQVNLSSQASDAIDASQFTNGTQITTQSDGTVIVSLPADTSVTDILREKRILTAAHVTKVEITAIDAAVNADYQTGVDDAEKDLTAHDPFSAVRAGSKQDIFNIMGNVTGVDELQSKLNALAVNPDGTIPSSDAKAKTDIDAWVNQQLSSLNLDVFIANGKKFTQLSLGQTLSTASSDTQNGYVDTIKAYLKGQLTAEAYYLWLLRTADNTPNTNYFGYAGDREAKPFETVSTQLRTAENLDSNYTSVQQTMYKGGFESAIAWMVASQSSVDNTLTDLGKTTAVTVKSSLLKDGYLPSVSGLSATDTLTGGNFNFGTDDFSNNTFASKQYIQAQAVNINTRNFNLLELELIKATAGDFYDSLRVMVGDAF